MHCSSRLKLPLALSVLTVLIVSVGLVGSMQLLLHAASTSLKLSASASPPASCGAWNIVSSPNVGTSSNFLNGVVALSAKDIWAVGDYNNNTVPNPLQTLTLHWDGTAWNVVSSPNVGTNSNVLNAIAGVSAKDVWAVGYNLNSGQQTLIEHWNGATWSVIPSPNVGTNTNVLNAVTKVPGSNQLWAVGYYNDTATTVQPLVEHWNGKIWSVIATPSLGTSDNILNGVTALSSKNVWAVGVYNNTSAGVEQTLIEHWNGTSWNVVSSPNQGSNGYLHALARGPGSSKLWAVGDFNNTSTSYETLTEYWNSQNWNIISSPNNSPEGSTSVNEFLGVAATSASNVWAVGLYQNSNGMSIPQTLIEDWNGTSWSIVSSPNPGAGGILTGVASVPSTTQLWAVGSTVPIGGGYQALIEFYC